MKSKILTMAIVAVIVITGCKKDEVQKSIKFKSDKYEVNYGEALNLVVMGVGIEAPFVFSVDDSEVGEIDNTGLFTAGLTGTTKVTVKKDDLSATCQVDVLPTVNIYTEPYLNFGCSKQEVLDNEISSRTFLDQSDDMLLYDDINPNVRNVGYMFTDGKMDGAIVLLQNTTEMVDQVAEFITQRYNYEGSSDGFYFHSRNGVVATISVDESIGLNVTYIENTYFKSTGINQERYLRVIKTLREYLK